MEIKTKDGFTLIEVEVWTDLRDITLDLRKTIILYNKTKNESLLNRACRVCNTFLELTKGLK